MPSLIVDTLCEYESRSFMIPDTGETVAINSIQTNIPTIFFLIFHNLQFLDLDHLIISRLGYSLHPPIVP